LSKTHTKYHHSKNKNKYIDLITEFIVNFFIYGSVFFYFIIVYFYPPAQDIINFRVLLMYSIFYTSIHILDYTLGESDIHRMHHIEVEENNKICNLGPDFIDKIFDTNCNNKYENTNKYSINLIIIFTFLQLVRSI
jgi:sterol desaturase/sphingolipid hydroxylase (fatty acid hydroxylase superfamily)